VRVVFKDSKDREESVAHLAGLEQREQVVLRDSKEAMDHLELRDPTGQ